MRRRRLILAAAGATLTACTSSVVPAPRATTRPALAANPGLGIWPRVVDQAPLAVREAYAFAAANERTLRWIPCYCGCSAQGHRDNFDCYVAEVRPEGWLVLDTHGLG